MAHGLLSSRSQRLHHSRQINFYWLPTLKVGKSNSMNSFTNHTPLFNWSNTTCVSFRRSPVAPLLARRSLPARSIKFRTPWTCCSVLWNEITRIYVGWQNKFNNIKINRLITSLTPNIRKVKTKWLLEDCSFMCVLPTDLAKEFNSLLVCRKIISLK